MNLRYDIDNENFSYYFLQQAAKMGEQQKQSLPKELLYKVFKKGYRLNAPGTAKLSLLEKLFILIKSLNKRWVIIIEDELNGMTVEDFYKYKELSKKKNFINQENAELLINEGIFVLGGTDLMDTFQKLNDLNTKAAYNYLMKVKTKNYLEPDQYRRNMSYVSRFISHYESQRKPMTMATGISMPEWLTLLFLYDGQEKVCSVLYKDKFKHSYNCSSTKLKQSFGTLQIKGLIIKHGARATAKFQITSLGKQKVNDLMAKYVVNC